MTHLKTRVRFIFRWTLPLAVVFALTAAGCHSDAAAAAAATPSEPAAPAQVEIAVGSSLHVMLDQALSSEDADGQTFQGHLSAPLTANGVVVVPTGAEVGGTVVSADPSGQFKGRAHLEIRVTSLSFGGQSYDLDADPVQRVSGSQAQGSEEKIGGGAVIGGVIGAFAGGKMGAAIGAGAGAGVGTGVQAKSRRQEVVLPAETVLSFTLRSALSVVPSAQ